MLPAFLITFREVIEASLIVATILGILSKLHHGKSVKTVWLATAVATGLSVVFIALGSLVGINVQRLYTGRVEEITEGILMVLSAIFITWAVFFLHKHFSRYKVLLLKRVKDSIEQTEQRGLFILVFTAVFREGFEIALFLSSIYFSSNPQQIFTGFSAGLVGGLLVSLALFATTIRLPVFYAFRATSILLILFAAGLLSRGIHEFAEVGLLPEIGKITLSFMPQSTGFTTSLITAVFGITKTMDLLQLTTYISYTFVMGWWVFTKPKKLTLDQ